MHPEYTLKTQEDLQEINAKLYEFIHNGSGAEILHIENDDDENVFSLSFRTYPESSNGVPHILEHTVLCGSEKYPIKDPFFSMSRRSLNTFMNAMTGSDFTCYPASSQVEKDFYNLLDVYIDAVFYPLLKEYSFMQEGHHLELEHPSDTNSKLKFAGIVFNEMKGAMSSPEARLWQLVSKNLYPDLTYQYNSGGEPSEIPNLTYQEFLDFHKKYYDPSRCLFYFYGNIPIEKHLDYLHERILKNTKKQSPIPLLKKQPRFKEPKSIEGTYPCSDKVLKGKTMIAFNWLTTHIQNQDELIAIQLIDSLLMETDASPLRHAMLQTGLCTQVFGMMDSEMSEIPYIIILKGTEKEHKKKLKEVLFKTLSEVCEKGIPKEQIKASLHQLELSRLEITGDGGPYGLNLFWRSALMKQHGANPADGLKIHSIFNKLKKNLEDPNYIPLLIKKYFIENSHFLEVVFLPDSELSLKELSDEKAKLEKIEKNLSKEEKKAIANQKKLLDEFQNREENDEEVECLPKVTKNDVPKDAKDYKLDISEEKSFILFHHECFTNDFIYADIRVPLPKLSKQECLYLQLLVSIMTELGTGNKNYLENLHAMQLYTGGIHANLDFLGKTEAFNVFEAELAIKGKCLKQNQLHLFSMMMNCLTDLRLDEKERIKELILQIYTYLHSALSKKAMAYSIKQSLSNFSTIDRIKNDLSGVPYYRFICSIGTNIDSRIDEVIQNLRTVYEQLKHFKSLSIVTSGVKQDLLLKEVNEIFSFSTNPISSFSYPFDSIKASNECYAISSSVAFNALAMPSIGFEHHLSAATNIYSELIGNIFLHKKIREAGGAYGSGASYHPLTQTFHYYSYRDPHIKKTNQVFVDAAEVVTKGKFSERDIEEAILGIIQDLDSPVSPGSRASLAYAWMKMGRTINKRQEYRQSLLNVGKKDLVQAAELIKNNLINSSFISFASHTQIEKEGKALKLSTIEL